MFAVGDKLGAYVIRRRIGVGGMGEVYLADHLHIGRKAAIKVLLPELSSRPDVVARFFNEARATGLLRHPSIVEILDCDVHVNGRAYIVMEFLEGETLGHCLARVGSFAGDAMTAAAIVGQMATALAAAHAKGIVHRDLKPDNVYLASTPEADTPLRVKILDFGIAKLLGEGGAEARKTRTGSLLGTPLYMSPEQCRGAGRIDHRTDVYSLGCIIFELLAGRPPFVREGHGELIIAHNSEPPPELAALVPAVPPALAALVAHMLVKDAAQRTQSMADVVVAIEDLLGAPAAQFGSRLRMPDGFPIHGGSDQPDEATEPAAASITVFAPDRGVVPTLPTPASALAAGAPTAPTPVPRTLVQSPVTKVLPERTTTLSQSAVVVPGEGAARTTPARAGLKVGAALAAVAAAGLAIFVLSSRSKAPGPLASAGATAPAVETTPVPESPPAPRFVTIDLEGAPAGLTVTLDGKATTAPVNVPFGSASHQLRLEAPGYKAEVRSIEGTKDKLIVLNMQPVAVAPIVEKPRETLPAAPAPPSRSEPAAPRAKKPKKAEKPEGFIDL